MKTHSKTKITYMMALAVMAVLLLPATAMADCANPAGKEGEITFNNDFLAFQGCNGTDWVAFHDPSCPAGDGCGPCSGSPTPGTTCLDGSIYVNDDASGAFYTTAANETGTYAWKTTATSTAGTTSDTNGIANTDAMETAGLALHPAAQACRTRGADWYLPARDELEVLLNNKDAGDLSGTFPAAWYQSSSADTATHRWARETTNGWEGSFDKTSPIAVRCVKR